MRGQSPVLNRSKRALKTSTILVGASGMIGQLLLVRELMISFYGNELTMGVVLANWLVMEACGAFVAGKFTKGRSSLEYLYLMLLVLYALFLPVALFFARSIGFYVLHTVPGEAMGVETVFLMSLFIVGLVSALHGAIFPVACGLLKEQDINENSEGRIYMYEALGTFLAGLLFTLLLAGRYHSLQLSVGIGVLHLIAAGLNFAFVPINKRKGLGIKGIFVFLVMGLIIGFPFGVEFVHNLSLDYQWGGYEVVYYGNSPYGNIVATHSEGEYTYFYDGRPVINVPNPDRAVIEDFVHLIMSSHPDPQNVLLLGGGLGGMLDVILKHPVEDVTYVELDYLLPEAVGKFPTSLTVRELEDDRVSVKSMDGRMYVSRTEQSFDLIILGFITPETLQSNRLFTKEFFDIVATRLNSNGIFTLSLPGSLTYLSDEMISLNSCIKNTLESSFKHTDVIPGDTNIFLASNSYLSLEPSTIARRLKEARLYGGLFSTSYIQYRLDDLRKEWFQENLARGDEEINRDFTPKGFVHTISLWMSRFSPEARRMLAIFQEIHISTVILAILLLTLILIIVSFIGRRNVAVPYAIFTSGFSGMGFDLLMLFSFQCIYGYVYQMIGLLVALFMVGTFLGAILGIRHANTLDSMQLLSKLELAVIGASLVFFGLIILLYQIFQLVSGYIVFALISLFAIFAGSVIGAQFPLAASSFSDRNRGEVAGVLYGADLLGGWSGGFAISLILFPLLGLFQTLIIMVCLKLSSFVILKIYSIKCKKEA